MDEHRNGRERETMSGAVAVALAAPFLVLVLGGIAWLVFGGRKIRSVAPAGTTSAPATPSAPAPR